MKKAFSFSFLLITIFSTSIIAQSSSILLPQNNLNLDLDEQLVKYTNSNGNNLSSLLSNVFFLNGIAYDITTLEKIPTDLSPGDAFFMEDQNILAIHIKDNGKGDRVVYFNADGTKKSEVNLGYGMALSPDYQYVLFIEENDIWIKDIVNFNNLGKKRRLTELGVFRQIKYAFWYANNYYPIIGDRCYRLNVKTGDLQEANEVYYSTYFIYNDANISPNRKYFVGKNQSGLYILNGETGENLSLNFNSDERIFAHVNHSAIVWLSNEDFLIPLTEKPDFFFRFSYYKKLEGFEEVGTEPIKLDLIESEYFTQVRGRDNSYIRKQKNRSICISPDRKFMLYPATDSKNFHNYTLFNLYNLSTKEVKTLLKHNVKETGIWNSLLGQTLNSQATFHWVSGSKIIYYTSGDLLNQGTWIHDVVTGNRQKISSFTAQQFWVFEEAGYVLFKANEKLYRVNVDGSEVIEFNEANQAQGFKNIAKLID